MPFGFLKKIFKKNAGDVAAKYGGESARDFVEDNIEKVDIGENEAGLGDLLSGFTGGQKNGLTSLFSSLGGSSQGLGDRAASKGN